MENDHNKHTRAGDPRYEFRLEPRLKGPFEAQIKNLGIIKQALFEGWVEEWVKQPDFVPRPLVDPGAINLRGLVARSLAERITQGDAAWIDDAIVEAVRGLGIGSIFGKRFDHYIEEKRFLSKKFSPWLLDRIVSLLRSGRRVCLLADSGTSIYFLMEEISQLLRKRCFEVRELAKMSILTNNFAVLRCYTEISGLRQVQLPDESMTELASYIKPNSTGGELQSEYAAFVGPDAIATLEKYRERMGDAHIIGLLAANWVRVIGGQAYPVAMYRDELQGKFKEAFVGICDEVYLPVPLGKVFVNRGASLIKFPEGNGGVRQYHDVPVNEKRATKTRLVTTSRAGELLLGRHSKNLMEAITLGPVACATSFPSGEAFTPIEQVPWRVLPFDEPSRWGKDEMNKEFPHEYSRVYQVLEWFAVRVGAK